MMHFKTIETPFKSLFFTLHSLWKLWVRSLFLFMWGKFTHTQIEWRRELCSSWRYSVQCSKAYVSHDSICLNKWANRYAFWWRYIFVRLTLAECPWNLKIESHFSCVYHVSGGKSEIEKWMNDGNRRVCVWWCWWWWCEIWVAHSELYRKWHLLFIQRWQNGRKLSWGLVPISSQCETWISFEYTWCWKGAIRTPDYARLKKMIYENMIWFESRFSMVFFFIVDLYGSKISDVSKIFTFWFIYLSI